MRSSRLALVTVVVALSLMAAACGDDTADENATTTLAPTTEPPTTDPETTGDEMTETPTSEPESTEAAPQTTTTTASDAAEPADQPAELRIAAVFVIPQDDPWNSTLVDAMDRAGEARPFGLDIMYDIFENIAFADAERLLRQLASSGDYGIIIAHSSYADSVAAVQDEFGDIAFAYSGSGNDPTGGNGYWIGVELHEAAYLAGVAAGLMSETNGVGAVAAFPFPDVNGPVNGFFDGARSVRPEIDTQVIYLETWFDPAKAREAGASLIASGADSLYAASAFGTFEAIAEGDRVFAIGDFADLEALAPHAVITSAVALWDPALGVLIDAWWDHHVNGAPYDAPLELIAFRMPEGGGDIAPLNENLVPDDVRAEVLAVRDQIMSGELVVELKTGPVE